MPSGQVPSFGAPDVDTLMGFPMVHGVRCDPMHPPTMLNRLVAIPDHPQRLSIAVTVWRAAFTGEEYDEVDRRILSGRDSDFDDAGIWK